MKKFTQHQLFQIYSTIGLVYTIWGGVAHLSDMFWLKHCTIILTFSMAKGADNDEYSVWSIILKRCNVIWSWNLT